MSKQLELNSPPKLAEVKRWFGTYRGIRFEINNFSNGEHFKHCWTHYIVVNIDKQLPSDLREQFWLKGELTSFREDGPKRVTYDYFDSIISNLEFHGGCTFYSKEDGFDGGDRWVKIGCDYQHFWDEGEQYSVDSVYLEVKQTIDSLFKLCKGRIKARSYYDGHYYDVEEETHEPR